MMRAKICCALRLKPSLTPYSSFVPRALHEYLMQLASRSTEEVPFGTVKSGAVLFADASGFTALTERLARRENGAEELCRILNGFFTILVGIVHKFGGDIVKFAGDAVSIVWMVDCEPGAPRDLAEATLWATCCACEIHKRLHNYVATSEERDPVVLSLHIGVGCGQLTCIHVGGVFARWEFVAAGPPMGQIAIAEPLAEPGETVLSPEAWALVADHARGTRVQDLVHVCTKEKAHCAEASKHRHRYAKPEEYNYVRIDWLEDGLPPPPPLPPPRLRQRDIAVLRRYIPAAVQPKLKAGHDGHLAELRDVSVLFVKCEGLNISADAAGNCAGAIDSGQQLMLCVQHTVYSCEGSINKFLVDDKGLLLLCVFGLPPLAHMDDPKRAIVAAQLLVDRIAAIGPGVNCSVGIASGRAFCGVIGSKDRREYTVIGDMVNLAARLMAAAGPSEVLVDDSTRAQTTAYFNFETRPSMLLKGKSQPTPIFKPVSVRQKTKSVKVDLSLQSRAPELQQLKAMLSKHESNPMVLTGERGSGKSALVDALAEAGAESKLAVLMGDNKGEDSSKKTDSIRSFQGPARAQTASSTGSTDRPVALTLDGPTFAAWRGVFRALVERGRGPASAAEYVLRALAPADHPHAPLLNLVIEELNLPLPPAPTAPAAAVDPASGRAVEEEAVHLWHLNAAQKTNRMRKMLTDILVAFADSQPTLVILHLQTGTSMQVTVDPESWTLALSVAQVCSERPSDRPKLLLCVVSRPLINYCPVEFIKIVDIARRNNMLLQLKNLSRVDSAHYLRQVLAVSDLYPIPTVLEEYVYDNAAGNPKHIEELVGQLRKERAIDVTNGRVQVLVDNFDKVAIPEKMTGTTMGLIDRMIPRHQLISKVASMCDFFSMNMLRELIPYPDEMQHLPEVIFDLVDSGVFSEHRAPDIPLEVLLCDPEATVCYSFQCKLLKKQCNQLLLHANREELAHTRSKMAMMGRMKSRALLQTKMKAWLEWILSPAGIAALHRRRGERPRPLARKPAVRSRLAVNAGTKNTNC